MQVPEKLALIGGSILLSSTLIFTLKSQASSIIPHVGNSVSHIFNHIGDAQKSYDFDSNFQVAQQQGWKTGNWGTAKYYIDNGQNLHVGSGNLQGSVTDAIGNDSTHTIKTINIDQSVKAPQDSEYLFSGTHAHGRWGIYDDSNSSITSIHGMNLVDTSQVQRMFGIFADNTNLTKLDLNSWDTHNVNDLGMAFNGDNKLSQLNINDWDTSQVSNLGGTFIGTLSLKHLDISDWDTQRVSDFGYLFSGDSSLADLNLSHWQISKDSNKATMMTNDNSLKAITLSGQASLSGADMPDGIWQNGNQSLHSSQLKDGNSHPGTWIKQ